MSEQPDMGIFAPTMRWTDKETGEVVFEMKKKDNADYGGIGIYYIFKIHKENFSDVDAEDIFMHEAFPFIKSMAAKLDIALFDIDEMGERMQEKISEVIDSGVDLNERQVDVSLELMNYATEQLQYLTIGISTKPAEDLTKPPVELK